MKKIVFIWSFLLICTSGLAQGTNGIDPSNDINTIKRDTSYIYAESTMKDVMEALSGAQALLELKIYEWLRYNHPELNSEILVSKSKEKWNRQLTKRGRYNRIFLYVSKQDVAPYLKPKGKGVDESYSIQDKIAFIKRMYNDFFKNSSFDTDNLYNLRKYLTQDVADKIHMPCPYDGCEESDSSYIVDLFIDGSPSYERPDPGYRVVTRSIKPLENDWFKVTIIWDVVESPIIVGVRVQNTYEGLRVVDFSTRWDKTIDGLSEVDSTIEDWEMYITPEEQKMISLTSFYEIEPYIKQLKADERINGYGKYNTMPEDDLCHLFIYNKEGEIVAVLLKTLQNTYNLKTRDKDVISNYKNCGAIWFTLNGR